jgi:hypothetical protein
MRGISRSPLYVPLLVPALQWLLLFMVQLGLLQVSLQLKQQLRLRPTLQLHLQRLPGL